MRITLHSRDLHRKASVIYNNPDMFSDVQRAWALWVLSSQCFGGQMDNSWVVDKLKNTAAKRINNKKVAFTEDLAVRLQNCSLECIDAIYIIKSHDREDTFVYADPPYYNANMGHYDGYSLQDYTNLLEALSQMKGKFLLSSYPSDVLNDYVKRFGWQQKTFDMPIAVNLISAKSTRTNKRKIEVLTANYEI